MKHRKELPLKERWHIDAIHILHSAVILLLVAATFEDLLTLNWGDLIFDVTLLGNQLLPARACILTYIENIWRRKAGIRAIKGYISHYYLKEHEKEEARADAEASRIVCRDFDQLGN